MLCIASMEVEEETTPSYIWKSAKSTAQPRHGVYRLAFVKRFLIVHAYALRRLQQRPVPACQDRLSWRLICKERDGRFVTGPEMEEC